jgi:hypothetical protein
MEPVPCTSQGKKSRMIDEIEYHSISEFTMVTSLYRIDNPLIIAAITDEY